MDFVKLLRLQPLCRALRDRIFGKQESLDESVKSMSLVSELIAKKISFLLPSQEPDPREEDEFGSIDGHDPDHLVAVSLWEGPDFETACDNVKGLLSAGVLRFKRGCPRLGVSRVIPVIGIDPIDLKETYLLLEQRRGGAAKTVVVPKWNFLAHLRRFWREIRRMAAKGKTLKLSDFFGEGRTDFIMNFLALLELIRRKRVFARQDHTFGEIEFSPNLKRSIGESTDKPGAKNVNSGRNNS